LLTNIQCFSLLKMTISMSFGIIIEPKIYSFCNFTSSQCIKQDIKSMCLNSFRVLFLPVSLSYNHMLGSLWSKQFCLLFPSNYVEERNSEPLCPFVKLSSKGWGCSGMDDSTLLPKLLVDICHADNSEGIDEPRSSWG
jgi:hypothetical protein